uniref:DUF551 domain-containing protein n=1 Tax=Coprococcus catus TaxID=116085 RepID=UPI0022E45E23|nr:DUF551 domain-containing protein [Coprococcus catus]
MKLYNLCGCTARCEHVGRTKIEIMNWTNDDGEIFTDAEFEQQCIECRNFCSEGRISAPCDGIRTNCPYFRQTIKEDDMKQLLDQLRSLIDSYNEWIPVEERLPDTDDKVWITSLNTITNKLEVDVSSYGNQYIGSILLGKCWRSPYDCFFYSHKILAWKPYIIPEPYDSENKGE